MKGIYSNVLIWIEEAFWDYLFLCTIYILACVCQSWEGPLSWKACHRKLWAGDMLNTHLDMLSGRMLARTHTCTQDGFCRPRKAAQCRHLLFTLPPRVHCRRGHHSERTRRDWREWNRFSEMFPFAAPFTLGTTRALPNCTHFLHKLHMAVVALHIHQGALCQSGGSVPRITAGWHGRLNTARPYRAAFPALCLRSFTIYRRTVSA